MDINVRFSQAYPAPRADDTAAERPIATPGSPPTDPGRTDITPEVGSADEADQLKTAVSDIEKFLNASRRNLQFSTDEESGRLVVKVIASDTGELIRQLPSEEALRIARALDDTASILFSAKV